MASKFAWARGRFLGWTSRSPRETSTSSSSVTVTDIGAKARSCSPAKLWIDAMRLVFKEGITTTSSPTFTTPEAIWPAKPRKLWFGRTTH
jgi:hypothetical protein